MTVEFPCRWPATRPRTPEAKREAGRFKVASKTAGAELERELNLFGATSAVLTLNYAEQKRAPEAALWFGWNGAERVIACDRYLSRDANVRAIGLTIEAMRGIERWGTGEMLEQAMTGFSALPPPNATIVVAERPWYEVLGVFPSAPVEVCETVYRTLSKSAHPDAGGSSERMAELNRAIEEARSR
ncbi:MAG: hypothetical protein KIS66_13615 [Fimbriimonadaceae bacterium]|nr:hypothetical protein [Fimbriimonadaceae bacterium]